MPVDLKLFTDRTPVSKVPEVICSAMKRYGVIQKDDVNVTFCGLFMSERNIVIFFPRNTQLPPERSKQCFKMARTFVKAILRYTKERSSKVYAQDEGDGSLGSHRLATISALLDDYCTNGLYSRRLSKRVVNSGKPDWKRTISRQAPFPGEGGPVYLDIHGSKRRYISDCEVARIHAQVIQELDENYAWLVTGYTAPIAKDIKNVPLASGSLLEKLRVIDLELHRTFSDRDIRLLALLKDYLKASHGEDQSTSIIGLRYFHGMWEHMLDSTLKWKFPVNKLLSVPAYRFENGDIKVAANKGQRTDTVLRLPNSDRFAVVDAKYYGAQDLGSAPGWPDLVKQFFYAKALAVYHNKAQVRNVFIFPGQGPLKAVHMKNRASGVFEDTSYPPIECLYVDPLELIDMYVRGIEASALSNLVMFADG